MKLLLTQLLLWTFGAIYAQKVDTIKFKDGTYLLKVGDSLVINGMSGKLSAQWHSGLQNRRMVATGLYHNRTALVGLQRKCLVALLGPPDFQLPDRYIFETDFSAEGIYQGCWLSVQYASARITDLSVMCPN